MDDKYWYRTCTSSLARHPEVYEYYEEVYITHTVRVNDELVFRYDELEKFGAKVFQTVTREVPRHGAYSEELRIKSVMVACSLISGLTDTQFDKTRDRIMICGGPKF